MADMESERCHNITKIIQHCQAILKDATSKLNMVLQHDIPGLSIKAGSQPKLPAR